MEAPPLERKLAAILAADVAGYSRLMEADDEATLATLSSHRRLIDEEIISHRGRIAGTAGDSVLAEFASVIDAVHAALRIQQRIADENEPLPEHRRMQFRIGVNIGDVMLKDGDIFGDGVNIAARIESLASPGGICVSRGVRDHVRHKVLVGFEDLGEQKVKNIAQPIRVFQLRPDGVDPEPAVVRDDAIQSPVDDVEIEFWDSIKNSANPVEYRAYLERYPTGAFAALAEVRIATLEEGGPSASMPASQAVDPKAIELAFWETVKDSHDAEMYRAYLKKYPAGEFTALADKLLLKLAAGE